MVSRPFFFVSFFAVLVNALCLHDLTPNIGQLLPGSPFFPFISRRHGPQMRFYSLKTYCFLHFFFLLHFIEVVDDNAINEIVLDLFGGCCCFGFHYCFFFFDAKERPYYGQLYDALLLSLLLLFLISLVSAGVHLT